MEKLTNNEQKWPDQYIWDKFRLDNEGATILYEMRLAVFESFEFQRYLLGIYYKRLKEGILIIIRPILRFLRIHK